MYKRNRSKYVILWISRLGSFEAKRKLSKFWSFVLPDAVKTSILELTKKFNDDWRDLQNHYEDKVEIDPIEYDYDMKKYTCVCNGIVVKRNQIWRIKVAQLPGFFTDSNLTYISTTRL
jgi:hypothetical protein